MIIQALEHCTDPKLAIAIHLSFACSLRLGEVLGLRWKDVAISDMILPMTMHISLLLVN